MKSSDIKRFEQYNDIYIQQISFERLDDVWSITIIYTDTKTNDIRNRQYVMDAGIDVVWERFTRELRKQREDQRIARLWREPHWLHIDVSGTGTSDGTEFLRMLKDSDIDYTLVTHDDYTFEWGVEVFADPDIIPFIESKIGEKYSKYESVDHYRILEKEE